MAANEFVVRAPHPALRGLVTSYLGYRQSGVTLAVHRGLPSRHVTLVISLADPIRIVGMPGGEQRPVSSQALVGGMHAGPALIAQDRFQAGLHLELNPLGVRTLLGLSSAELSTHVVDLADMDRPLLAGLPDMLLAADTWALRFRILDERLCAAASEPVAPVPEIGWAWRRMVRAGGLIGVQALAAEVGWSRRHFAERFRTEVGLAPKQAARVIRFERACVELRRSPGRSLAELAAACGFYDQSHLTHEWQALAGCSPGAWIAEELPFLQGESSGAKKTGSRS